MLEVETLSILDVMLTSGFWKIILVVNSPLIFVGIGILTYRYYKNKRESE